MVFNYIAYKFSVYRVLEGLHISTFLPSIYLHSFSENVFSCNCLQIFHYYITKLVCPLNKRKVMTIINFQNGSSRRNKTARYQLNIDILPTHFLILSRLINIFLNHLVFLVFLIKYGV